MDFQHWNLAVALLLNLFKNGSLYSCRVWCRCSVCVWAKKTISIYITKSIGLLNIAHPVMWLLWMRTSRYRCWNDISCSPNLKYPSTFLQHKRHANGYLFKGVVDWFFSRLDCVYGVQSSMCSCLVFLKTHYFSHNLPLFHTSLSLLWQTPQFISWFYEAPPSEIRDWLRLVSWLSVLWLAKPPLLHVWTSRPSPQWHVLRLNCKQWRCL